MVEPKNSLLDKPFYSLSTDGSFYDWCPHCESVKCLTFVEDIEGDYSDDSLLDDVKVGERHMLCKKCESIVKFNLVANRRDTKEPAIEYYGYV